jgi:prevent-host-death family protein
MLLRAKIPSLAHSLKMTIMTIMSQRDPDRPRSNWTVAEAKARFSELVAQARSDGPQTITKHGRAAAVIVSAEEWERKSKRTGNLAEFFANSPLRGSDLTIDRRRDRPRQTDL